MTDFDISNYLNERDSLIEHYIAIAEEMKLTDNPVWAVSPSVLKRRMKHYALDFLQAISGVMESRTYATEGLFHQLSRGVEWCNSDFILDCLHFHEMIGGDEYLMTSALVELIPKYEKTREYDPYRAAPEKVQQEYLALMKFVLAFLYRDPENGYDWECEYVPKGMLEYDGQHMGRTYAYYIAKPAMVSFVREHSAQVDQITDIIKDRQTADPKVILPLLTDAPSALRRGVL